MSFAINYHQWIIDEFEPYLGRITAEVGAGLGSVSRLLLGKKIERLFAFEPSRNLCPLLTETLGGDERVCVINDYFGPKHAGAGFDCVVYINVLEHIEDDETELVRALEALKPKGHLLLFVPALAWLYSDLDKKIGHFRRYTKDGLSQLAKDAGFTLIKSRYFDFAGILPWYVNFVLLRNSMAGSHVSLYDRLVVPAMRKIESFMNPPIGKNVLLVGQKA